MRWSTLSTLVGLVVVYEMLARTWFGVPYMLVLPLLGSAVCLDRKWQRAGWNPLSSAKDPVELAVPVFHWVLVSQLVAGWFLRSVVFGRDSWATGVTVIAVFGIMGIPSMWKIIGRTA